MAKEKLAAARELIKEKHYAEARAILKTIDDPIATEWLRKLDEIAPEKKKKSYLTYILALIAVALVAVIVMAIFTRPSTPQDSNTSLAVVPTQMELPSETPTFTNTPTSLPELPSKTPLPSATDTAQSTQIPIETPISPSVLTSTAEIRQMTGTALVSEAYRLQTEVANSVIMTQLARPTTAPSRTPQPSPTYTMPFIPQTAQIGPIYDELYDSQFSAQVAVRSVQFSQGGDFERPSPGNVYAIVDLTLTNLGPGEMRFVSPVSFQMLDANGAARSNTYIFFRNCDFDFVDLTSGGSVSGCVAFEVPATGRLEFIYAPFQYEGLTPGRYASIILRQ